MIKSNHKVQKLRESNDEPYARRRTLITQANKKKVNFLNSGQYIYFLVGLDALNTVWALKISEQGPNLIKSI